MALLVWLPLNGNLNNQGLSDVTVTNNGATIDDNGKIGLCYNFSGSSYLSESTFDWSNFNVNQFSLCCWYKEPSVAAGNSQILCIGTNSGWNNIRIGLLRRTSNGYPMFSVSDGTNNVNYNFTATTFPLNVWNHIAVTYDSGKLKMYINGILNKEGTTTIVPALNSSQHLGIGAASNGAEKLLGYLNDVRIYDHALSPKEVKEMSKGLILHCPLNTITKETTNLLGSKSTYFENWGSWGFGGGGAALHVDMEPAISGNVGKVINTKDVRANAEIASGVTNAVLNKGESITASVYVKGSPETVGNRITVHIYKGNGTNSLSTGTYYTLTDSWQRISHTLTWNYDEPSNSAGNIYIACSRNSGEYFYVSNALMELGNFVSYFTESSIPGSTIVDCSGYKNDITINGNLVSTNDSLKYDYSIKFPDNACAIGIGNLKNLVPEGIFTFNIWFKKVTGEWSTKAWETILGGPSGFELEGKLSGTQNAYIHPYSWGGGSTTTPNSYSIAYELDKWNMVTMVRTTSNTKFYLNGELKVTGAKGSIPSGDYFIGAWKTATQQNYRGLLSDARIYATALSDTDILELYNTSASIDNKGNMFGYEFNEENNSSESISKAGIVKINNFVEYSDDKIKILDDGSVFMQILYHNNPKSQLFTESNCWANNVDGLYSGLNILKSSIYNLLSKYEFIAYEKLTSSSTETIFRWSLTSNPALTSTITGKTIISGSVVHAEGLKNNGTNAAMHNGSTWWCACGSWTPYQGGIPGFNGVITTGYLKLYVRIPESIFNDTISGGFDNFLKFYQKTILENQLIEI